MNYQKIYDDIIIRAKNRNYTEEYGEIHHILPRCMGGTDDPKNLVKLTPEEHFVCHQLLVKIYPKNYKLVLGLHMMCIGVDEGMGKNYRTNNKKFGWIKRKMYKRLEWSCKYCGKTSLKMPCHMDKIYCNKKCYKLDRYKKYTCKHCNKEYWKASSYETTYCSDECSRIGRTKMTERVCKGCGGTFFDVPSSKIKHCSLDCHYQHNHPKKIVKCWSCENHFTTFTTSKKRFCSSECREKSFKKNTEILIPCKRCSKIFNSYNPQRNRKYCSRECINPPKTPTK